jgi:hypothetical protein
MRRRTLVVLGWLGPRTALKVGQQLEVQAQGGGGIAALGGPVCDVVAGGQGVGVAGAQDGFPVGQQFLVQAQGGGGVPALAGPVCDVVAGGQGVGVAGALDGFLVGQQLLVQAQRRSGVPAVASPGCDVGAGGQGVGGPGRPARRAAASGPGAAPWRGPRSGRSSMRCWCGWPECRGGGGPAWLPGRAAASGPGAAPWRGPRCGRSSSRCWCGWSACRGGRGPGRARGGPQALELEAASVDRVAAYVYATPALGLIPLHAHCGCDGYFDRRQGSAGSNSSAAASRRASTRSGRALTFSARPLSSPWARTVNVEKSLVRDGSEAARFRSIARRDRRWRNRRFIATATS